MLEDGDVRDVDLIARKWAALFGIAHHAGIMVQAHGLDPELARAVEIAAAPPENVPALEDAVAALLRALVRVWPEVG
jgi:hypothetical protein